MVDRWSISINVCCGCSGKYLLQFDLWPAKILLTFKIINKRKKWKINLFCVVCSKLELEAEKSTQITHNYMLSIVYCWLLIQNKIFNNKTKTDKEQCLKGCYHSMNDAHLSWFIVFFSFFSFKIPLTHITVLPYVADSKQWLSTHSYILFFHFLYQFNLSMGKK